jgi:hypothetical protein
MLGRMKAEFKEIGYAQLPKVTTTRKLDLNKPFTLTPDDFDPRKGKKRSLLVGCNYSDLSNAELKASHDDIKSMKVRLNYISAAQLACSLLKSHASDPIPLCFVSKGLHCQRTQFLRKQRFDDNSNG